MVEEIGRTVSFEERRAARILREALKVLGTLYPRLSLAQADTFIRVAWEEGLTVSELANRCGVPPYTVSRHLRDLGATNRLQGPSLGLITIIQRPHGDRRQRYVVLTKHGIEVARRMGAIVQRR